MGSLITASGTVSPLRALKAALDFRMALMDDQGSNGQGSRRQSGTDCFRLFGGEGDGIAGLVIELWGQIATLHVYEDIFTASESELREIAAALTARFRLTGVYLKYFSKDRSLAKKNGLLELQQPFWGKRVAEVTVEENGVQFNIRPEESFSVGLFLDQRQNRKWVRDRAAGKRVLNLFAYTCGFSVGAALGKATKVSSVDLSQRYLDWGKTNFSLNGLVASDHAWWRGDSREILRRLKKRGEYFDLVVCDPPTFSRDDRGKVFQIHKDIEDLVKDCAEVIAPGGEIFVSSNYVGWNQQTFDERVRAGLRPRLNKALVLPPPAPDFKNEKEQLRSVAFSIH